MLLEVCVDSFDSAKTAIDNGADRLEVCGPLGVGGGTSPSFALVSKIHSTFLSIPLMVMVRPRPGDFVYSQSEIEVMADEIRLLKSLSPPVGVVLGCLLPSGAIDIESTRYLVEIARPMEVTFHRAFDMIHYPADSPAGSQYARLSNAYQALIDINGIPGITRVLTSGLSPSLPAAIHLFIGLRAFLKYRQSPNSVESRFRFDLQLLPGSGLNPSSLASGLPPISTEDCSLVPSRAPTLLEAFRQMKLKELHASCSSFVDGPVVADARREGMGMGGWDRWQVKGEVVREMRRLLDE